MNVQSIVKNVTVLAKRNSPKILTGLGIVGVGITAVMAARATPKALYLLDKRKEELDTDELTKFEVVKTVWKPYLPAVITGGSTIACIAGAGSINEKRNAAITAAYEVSRVALQEYRNKVVETVGEVKEKEIQEKVYSDKISKKPVITQDVILTERGNTLCYDALTGRYFRSDINFIKKVENELNMRLRNEMYVGLNEFYYEIGLPSVKIGNELGWNVDEGLINFDFSAQMADDGPIMVIDYLVGPRYGYKDLL